jgi:putative ABC transport system permease protein
MELFIGLVVFLLSSSLLVYLINKQSKSIGLLKALGYQQKEITLTFLIKTIILSFIATILGIILSHFGLNIFQAFMTDSDGSLILEVIKSFKLYLNAALIVFVIVLLATTLTLRKMKKVPIIELIKRT